MSDAVAAQHRVPCDAECDAPLCNCFRCHGPACLRPPAQDSKFCAVCTVVWGGPVLTEEEARRACITVY